MISRLFALIPCAGTGSRAGSPIPKQYRTIAGRNLLYYSLAAFDACSEFTQTLVVLAPDDGYFDPRRFGALRYAVKRCGGETRHASVHNGLLALAEFGARDDDWVLVHDAARPGITPGLIRALVTAVRDDPVGGIVAMPVADTLKRVNLSQCAAGSDDPATPRIGATEPRDHLWQAQTPQMFRIGMLREALVQAQARGHAVTDEACALESLGYAPRVVQGSLRNFKVTYPEDFALAEAFLTHDAAR
ncbi:MULTISPECIES: 2-C-methyl-D-erythritol 4-phosphate cytidylyltransferase [Burkholderiaceae]|uniref:2-C-methyl-D-erythritol 4-phosphate cytidylyltransferase n=1 Tax=Burkholderiaceae TaxID=119060 RepID=UPI0009699A45|nr:2-C-methyl-D-erythritol 4-phosphate cytidylyltransferase [Burkholderia sp. b13]MCG1018667.1 2-C-methyl-D-erythritol 4-phosphate cytidylyltransferase [Mycetohabitans sp. B4]SIT75435.1 2-C-methyl-D-erythritol 4-phosphate cytidylyltransferase [Burkholderia sp. b13]